jgi:hypothetical protein
VAKRAKKPDLPALTWRAFVHADGRAIDLARDGTVLYERSGGDVRVRKFVGDDAATAQEIARAEALEREDYVERAAKAEPATRPAVVRPTSFTASMRAEGWAAFHERLPEYVARLEEAKIDLFRRFEEQGTPSRDVNATAAACVEIAAQVFSVPFRHRVAYIHDAPRQSGPIGRRETASFFTTAARVAAIACLKMQGRLWSNDGDYDDDVDNAHLDLEIAARMKELAKRA